MLFQLHRTLGEAEQIITPLAVVTWGLDTQTQPRLFFPFDFLSVLLLLVVSPAFLVICTAVCRLVQPEMFLETPRAFYVSSPEQFVLHFLSVLLLFPPPTVCFSIFEKSTKKQRTKHDALPSVMISGDCGDGGMLLKRGIMTRRERKSLWRTEMTLLIKIKCLSAGWNGADRASRLRGRRFLAPDLLLNLKTFFSAVEVRKEPG